MLQCILSPPLKLDLCWSFYQLFELVNFGDLNLVLMWLMYIIVTFSVLGMWGYAEYCRLASDTFLVVYIYMMLCSNFVFAGCSWFVSVVCSVLCLGFGFGIK